ncbi:tryptophan synthase subunit alpha [Nocardioides campestrisoli]|uniref:tryptophan synthase subunit alpha n=1 Tax=Nocardioides campestrisoli TaxID=2736757 RepID=UPI001CD59498|nr:tryptophan synthase subunit alpha [Nocardioides campestrisoli]
MTHLVVGYPSLDANWSMLQAMDRAGVDLVELQLPFSEPIADGPSFVRANHEAIRSGTGWREYFDLAGRAAAELDLTTLFMGYYNSVVQMGAAQFCEQLAKGRMSGFIVPDLPPEEGGELYAVARSLELDPVQIMTPTNSRARLQEIGRHASGFVYCAARTGVTGRQTDVSQGLGDFLGRCREATSVPLGVGFGIRTPDDIRALRGSAEIAIVGTAGTEVWLEQGLTGYEPYLDSLVAEAT